MVKWRTIEEIEKVDRGKRRFYSQTPLRRFGTPEAGQKNLGTLLAQFLIFQSRAV
jgi:hypothetical protein